MSDPTAMRLLREDQDEMRRRNELTRFIAGQTDWTRIIDGFSPYDLACAILKAGWRKNEEGGEC